MKNKNQTVEIPTSGAQLLILIAFTATALILITEILTHGWGNGFLPVLVFFVTYSWAVFLMQKLNSVYRTWLYAFFMMSCYFVYGIHQTNFGELALAAVVIILIYFVAMMHSIILMTTFTYFFTVFFNMAKEGREWPQTFNITLPQLLLQFFLVILATFVAHIFILGRSVEFKLYIKRADEEEKRDIITREHTRTVAKELGELSRENIGELLILREKLNSTLGDVQALDSLRSVFDIACSFESQMADLKEYSDLLSEKTTIQNGIYEIQDLLLQLRPERHMRHFDKEPELVIDLDPAVPKAFVGDGDKILKILRQLIDNGMRYTQKGGVQAKISTKAYGDEVNLCIEVNDTGVGIEQSDLERLLEEIDNRRTVQYRPGSLGLGLYLVSGFVKLMGGFFRIESKRGSGVAVCVSIPQRVSDAVPCMSYDKKLGFCLVYDLNERKNNVVTGFYENLVKTFSERLAIPAYRVRNESELGELTVAYNKVCLLTEDVRYEENRDYYESLKDVYLAVLTARDLDLPKDSIAHIVYKPFGTTELYHMIEDAKNYTDRRKKSHDREYMTIHAETLAENYIREHDKKKIMIVTDSMSDLPPNISVSRGIPVISIRIFTERGSFMDGHEVSQECALSYLKEHKNKMYSKAPDEAAFRNFFEDNLKQAEHIIYISTAKKISNSFECAAVLAQKMKNITVVNSGQVSGGVTLMVLKADEMAKEGKSVEEIVAYLEYMRPKIKTTFLIDNLNQLANVGKVSKGISVLAGLFKMHPVIRVKRDAMSVNGIYFGNMENAKKHYIKRVLRHKYRLDTGTVFVGVIGLLQSEVAGLEQQLIEDGNFENVIIRRASAANSLNCGAGTFGIIYVEK
ncbi:MAG: DegV family EDD domain-containing protein [Eubacterium sp.]|nr:DegV family EDD domain-containing protein [Eubacterium sp.]